MISNLLLAAGLTFAGQPGCETCHAAIARSFAAMGMGQSAGAPAPAKTRFRHELSGSTLSVSDRQHRIERGPLSAEYTAALRIGSGKIGSSFAVRIGGHWFQSPVSWYAQSAQFRISPGYEQEKYPDFDRRIRGECFYCHSSGSSLQPTAITCQRCHGEGAAHAVQPTRVNIVNPARLTGAVRDSVCEQCHLSGAVRILNPGKRAHDFVPGQALEDIWTTYVSPGDFRVASHSEQLAASACRKASGSRLWCGTCHNPHPAQPQPASDADAACKACHEPHAGGRSQCASCHMPKRNVQDVVHTAYTDHRIQLPGTTPPAGAGQLGPWRPAPARYAERNLALAWFELAASTRDARAMQFAAERISRLDSLDKDAQVLSAKASIALQRNAPQEAIEAYTRVLKLQPKDEETHFRLGRAQQAAGHLDAALKHYEDAIRLDPLLFDAYVLAAQLHRANGDWTAYRQSLERYLRHMPQSLAARQALSAIGR